MRRFNIEWYRESETVSECVKRRERKFVCVCETEIVDIHIHSHSKYFILSGENSHMAFKQPYMPPLSFIQWISNGRSVCKSVENDRIIATTLKMRMNNEAVEWQWLNKKNAMGVYKISQHRWYQFAIWYRNYALQCMVSEFQIWIHSLTVVLDQVWTTNWIIKVKKDFNSDFKLHSEECKSLRFFLLRLSTINSN